MARFGFGVGISRRRLGHRDEGGTAPQSSISLTIGALTRNTFGAGAAVSGNQIVSGDANGHWTIENGRLFPSAIGAEAELNAGPYSLEFEDGWIAEVEIEPSAWDVTDQSEWDFIANQSALVLAGRTIALRNTSPLSLGINGAFGTPLRRVDLRDAENTPLTIKGRLGAQGDWSQYCEFDKVASLRGTRGVTFQHLRTTPAPESKFVLVGESTRPVDDITIEDCWITGLAGEPDGDYSNSADYPNRNRDMIATTGSAAGSVGNLTISNCLIEWGASLINVAVTKADSTLVITGNHCRYFYDDGIAAAQGAGAAGRPVNILGNFIIDAVGKATDSDNPHVDAIRVLGTTTASADWDAIRIEHNIVLKGTARGEMQAMLLDDLKTSNGDSGHFFIASIRNNIIACDAAQGIWVNQAKNCEITQNTVVGYGAVASNSVSINCATVSLNDTNGGGNVISDNIADVFGISGGDTTSGNVACGRNGSVISYPTLFEGTDFAPVSEAAAKAVFAPKTSAGALSS